MEIEARDAAALGFDPGRLEQARALCRQAVASGTVPALALAVGRRGKVALAEGWGRVAHLHDLPPGGADAQPPRYAAAPDTVWLIASVTKPVVCGAVMLLLERGLVALDDPVHEHLPEFAGAERAGIRIRHLLTHTSGLPDMVPENLELRRRHAPLAEFVRCIYSTPLLFPPGTQVSYQSAGIALLGEIVSRRAGRPLPDFLRAEFFEPLGMKSCSLGWRPELAGRAAACRLEGDQKPTDWDWNSAYWRSFGAPWGGMFAGVREFLVYMQMLAAGGTWEGRRYFSPATLREWTRNQTGLMPELPEAVRARATWGLGWRLAAGRDAEFFGDLAGLSAYGHNGATGTAVFNDPDSGISFVLFTNTPGCYRFIGRVASAVTAAAT